MKQFIVTHKNGVELSDPLNIGLDPEKIVKVYSVDGSGTGEAIIEYAEIDNRRINKVTYQMTLAVATITALITEVYDIDIDKNDLAFPISVNTVFISSMRDTEVRFQNGDAAAVELVMNKGSVGFEDVYALGTTLTALAGAVVTNP